jgi:very-short-patch-repair endonuclease
MDQVSVHWSDHADPAQLLVEPWIAIDQVSTCVSAVAQLAAADAALRRGLMVPSDLARFRVTPAARRRWLELRVDPRAESPLESIARAWIVGAGLSVESQTVFAGVGRVDLVVEGSVVVELDGREFHEGDAAFVRDRVRDRNLQALGLDVARFTFRDIARGPDAVLGPIRAILEARRRGPYATHGSRDTRDA